MRRRFRGTFDQKVDGKGRVSIPAPFRRVIEAGDPDWTKGLNPNLVIVFGDHRRKYLEVYTIEAIDEVDELIATMDRASIEREMLETLFNAQTHPTNVDETGRLVLPLKLRQKIGLENEAFFISKGDTFQIWNPDTYAEVEQRRAEDWLSTKPADFNVASLLPSKNGG